CSSKYVLSSDSAEFDGTQQSARPSGGFGFRAAGVADDQVLEVVVETGHHLGSGGSHRDHIAIAHSAVARDVYRRLDVEHHAGLQHVRRLRVQAGARLRRDGVKAYAVAGGVPELLVEASRPKLIASRAIHISRGSAGSDDGERGSARRQYGFVDAQLSCIRFA